MTQPRQTKRARPTLEEFEPRILYSADARTLLNPLALAPSAEMRVMELAPPPWASAQISATTTEIAFVDTQLPGYQTLVADLLAQSTPGRHIEVVLLDSHSSGIDQITAALQGRSQVDAIHIFSDGNDGSVQLGDTRLNALTLAQNQGPIASWGGALNASGDILIYGCDLAATSAGQRLVKDLRALTHAAVAASTDPTGSAALGGNWVLEFQTGAIGVPVAIDAAGQVAFAGLMGGMGGGGNHAPITDVVSPISSLTNEDTVSTSYLVSELLGAVGWSDVDAGAVGGVAVTAASGRGTWQFSSDGSLWTNFGAVASANALLLDAATLVRYVPDGYNGDEVASLSVRAWDQTTGAASVLDTPSYADLGAGGGGTAYSTLDVVPLLILVSSVNDAPTGLGNLTLDPVVQNSAAPAGTAISALAGLNFTDVDTGAALGGVAVIGNGAYAATQGAWQYSSNAGANWAVVGSVANDSALVLSPYTELRFVPVAGYSGAPTPLSVRALDNTFAGGSSTTAGAEVRVTISAMTHGGSTAISSSVNTISTSVNDSPSLANAAKLALVTTNEDTVSSATQVDAILTAAGWADPNAGALSGIAITAMTGNGTWQYSSDGVTWVNLGAVSASNALLLTSKTRVHYVPDSRNAEVPSVSFKAWDKTTGSASTNATPVYADPGAGGGASAYSSQVASASLVVTPVNDAPTVTSVWVLPSISENAGANFGVDVSLLASGFGDVDSGALSGMAITGVDSSNGNWQYTLNGTNWVDMGHVSDSSARLLPSDATTRIRFVPNANWNGVTGQLYFQAWDQTSGSAGGLADASLGGGTTAFSVGTYGSAMSVLPVNNAPTALGAAGALAAVAEDTANPAGTSISSLFGALFSDAADQVAGASSANNFAGAAVVGNTADPATEGVWQWFDVSASQWSNVSTSVSTSGALLLDASTQVRFLPAANYNGTPGGLTVRLIDDSSGAVATAAVVDIGSGGGTTPYSSAGNSVLLQTQITAVNDAPTGLGDLTLAAVPQGTLVPAGAALNTLAGLAFADVDSGATLAGVAVVRNAADPATQGVWQYSGGGDTTWYAIGMVANEGALVLSAGMWVRFVPAANYHGTPPALTVRALDNSYAGGFSSTVGAETRVTLSAALNGGTTAISSSTNTISTSVTATNTAPTLGGAVAGQAVSDNATLSPFAALTVADSDNPAQTQTVSVTLDNAAKGSFTTLNGFTDAGGGVYTYSGTAAAAQAAIRGLVFTPAANRVMTGGTESTGFAIRVTDSAGASATDVTTSVLSTSMNDAPVLSGPTVASYIDTAAPDIFSVNGGVLAGNDVDVSSTLTYGIDGGTVAGGVSTLSASYGTLSVTTATGAYTYTPDAAAINALTANSSDNFSVTVSDGALSATATYSVMITGANDAAVLAAGVVNLSETNAPVTASGTLTISDIDSPATFVAQASTAGAYGSFAIDTTGAWSYTASSAHNEFVAGQTYTDTFAVTSADGTATSVTVNITGTNNAAVLSAATLNLTETDAPLSASGTLTISDVDSPASYMSQAPTTGANDSFSIDAAGAWIFTASSAHSEYLAGQTYTDVFAVSSVDGTSTSVTVNITGTNTAAVLSSATVSLTETNAPLSASGRLTISDIDSPATFVAQASTAGTYGSFAIDTTGAWSYTTSSAHNEFVAGQIYSDSFAVSSVDGTTTRVTVHTQGSNDAPTTALVTLASVVENSGARLITQSELLSNAADVDGPVLSATALSITRGGGSLVDNGDGSWSYTPAANDATSVSLGYVISDGVAMVAGSADLVIVPVNHAPAITGAASVALGVPENSVAVTQVNATDVDWPAQALSYSITGGADAASFALDAASGALRFVVAPNFEAPTDADGNNIYQVTVQVSDGSLSAAQSLSVTVTNVQEAPVLAGGQFPVLATEAADAGAPVGPAGTLVSALVGNEQNQDASARLGVAVTGADIAHGSWWFSSDNGASWNALGAVSDANARLLAADAGTRVYFQPDGSWSGSVPAALTLRAWDASSGTNGSLGDAQVAGGAPVFSQAMETAALTIAPAVAQPLVADATVAQALVPPVAQAAVVYVPVVTPPAAAPTANSPSATARMVASDRNATPMILNIAPASPPTSVFATGTTPTPDSVGASAAASAPAATGSFESISVTYANGALDVLRFLQLKTNVLSAFGPFGLTPTQTVSTTHLNIGPVRPADAAQSTPREASEQRFELGENDTLGVVGIVVSAGFVTWALRAAGLLTTLLVSLPAWRHIDPLPILGEDEDKPNWKGDERADGEHDREEDAMSGLWGSGARVEMEAEA